MTKKAIRLARQLLAQYQARDKMEFSEVMLINDARDLAVALDLAKEVLKGERERPK